MAASPQQHTGNPAVVGLAGFALTTLVLQFHNLGWIGVGPVLGLGLVFGGLAQFIAGFQEKSTGNNLGFCAFTGYGAFWISLALIILLKPWFPASRTDVGFYLVAWTLFTAILWVPAMRVNGALATVFSLLLVGFLLLDIAHFVPVQYEHAATQIAAWELIACALSAFYLMAHNIYKDVFGRDVLPAGQPWIGGAATPAAPAVAATA